MNVRICKSCGHMFNSIGGRYICPNCLKKQDEQLETVKEYIGEHPTAKIEEVAKACGVSSSSIILIGQGRKS